MPSFFDKLKKGMKVEKLIEAGNDSADDSELEEDVSSRPLKRKKFLNLVGNAGDRKKTRENGASNKREKAEEKEKRNKEKELVKFLAFSKEEKEKKKARRKALPKSTATAASFKNKVENKKMKKMKKENKTKNVEEKKGELRKIEIEDKEEESTLPDKTKKSPTVGGDKKWFEPARQNFSMENLGGQEGELTIDLYQTDKDIIIQSVIAGITPEDIDISIENDMVIIKGNRKEPLEGEKRKYFFKECYWGRFSREIVLPEEVDNSRAQASLENGVLTIRMPKIERSKKRKIVIK